jgi:hypothetical protein
MSEKKIDYVLKEYQDITDITKSRLNQTLLSTKKFALAGSGIGFLGGIFFAYKRQSGVLGYLGWAIAFNILGGVAGGVIDTLAYDKSEAMKGAIDKALADRMSAYIKDAQPFISNPMVKRDVDDIKKVMSLVGYKVS